VKIRLMLLDADRPIDCGRVATITDEDFMISAGIYILTIAFAAYVIYSVVRDK
jgi:hypothetical protein